MILGFCIEHRSRLMRSMTLESLAHNRGLLEAEGAPLGVRGHHLQAVLASALFVESAAGARWVPSLQRIKRPNAAENARLISKGRILYEHCMAELSHACVIGFMHHELTKSRSAEGIVLDLLGWMVEQRLEGDVMTGEAADLRRAHTDYMLDQGVSLLHGCDRATAARLAADKEPLD